MIMVIKKDLMKRKVKMKFSMKGKRMPMCDLTVQLLFKTALRGHFHFCITKFRQEFT
jgi:hypothetical protein